MSIPHRVSSANIPILLYHDISEIGNPWCVSPAAFEQQMRWLKENGWRSISLSELQQGLQSSPTEQGGEAAGQKQLQEQKQQEKLFVLTFDDARRGVYEHVFSLLRELGFTATIYIVPQWVEGKDIPPHEHYSSFMTWEQLKEMAAAGFTLGSHSFSHRDLTALPEGELQQELEKAKVVIQEKTGKAADHFSYPYGRYNQEVQTRVLQHYQTAVSMDKGFSRNAGAYARQAVMRDTSLDAFRRLLSAPTLSLCMIVKDEEQFLEPCLKSVQALADEIIIVDTGSADRTKEIARQFTDKVYKYQWQDDFAAARNESLGHAAGDWILVLDADEVLSPEDHSRIVQAIADPTIAGYRMLTRNYSNNSSIAGWQLKAENDSSPDPFQAGFGGWFPSLKVRLFQRRWGNEQIQFQGRVHELVDGCIEQHGGKLEVLPVAVHHYGALRNAASQKEKLQEHVALQQRKIADNPSDAKSYAELGIQYKELGNYAEAARVLRQSLKLDSNAVTPRLNLALVLQRQGLLAEAREHYEQALQQSQENQLRAKAEAYFGLGYCSFREEQLEDAAAHFRQAVQHNPAMVDAYINLGAIYERQGKFQEALNQLRQAALLNPRNARVYYNTAVVQEKTGNLSLAVECYGHALQLGYPKQEEVKARVEKLKEFLQETGDGSAASLPLHRSPP